MGYEIAKALIVLVILLAGVYLLLRFLKQSMILKKGPIEMLHYYPLGQKKGIGIFKIASGYYVLSVADTGVSLLSKLTDEEASLVIAQIETSEQEPAKVPLLKRLLGLKSAFVATTLLSTMLLSTEAFSAPAPAPAPTGTILGLSSPLELLLFLTLLSFLPAILVMCTSFTRIVVVLSFLKQAIGTPQSPPNQVLIGLALFVTFFIMSPVIERIHKEAYQPYVAKSIDAEEALQRATVPLKEFMLKQTREKDLALFLKISKEPRPASPMDLPLKVVIPAFAIGELQKAFEIGFLIYLPFLVIDMIVGSVLLSMGMMMLPPAMVSLPVKLLLFVLADGWELVIGALIGGFR